MGKKKSDEAPTMEKPGQYGDGGDIQKSVTVDIDESKPKKEKESVPKPPRGKFGCRDIPFLILFIIFWVGLGIISIHTYLTVPYDTLMYGRNSYGELCGAGNFSDYKYITYIMGSKEMINAENPIKYKVCSNQCTTDYLLYNNNTHITVNNETIYHLSYLDLRNDTYKSNNLMKVELKNKTDIYEIYDTINSVSKYDNILIPSVDVFNRCIPSLEILGLGDWSDTLQGGVDLSTRIYQSVINSVNIILIAAGIALGLTFLWLILTYLLTGVFVWCSVLLTIAAVGGVTFVSWYIYVKADENGSEEAIRESFLNTNNPYVNKYLYNKKAFLVISIILSIIFLLTVLFFILARKRIMFGIKVIKEAGKAVMKYPLLSFIPLIEYIFIIILTVFFASIFVPATITSKDEISEKTRNTIANYTPLEEDDVSVKSYGIIIELYLVLGYYWTYYFIKAVGKTTICGTIATWYWTPKNSDGKRHYQNNVIIKTFIRIMFYNLGSLAFGSLILGIISVIKYILTKIQKIAEKNGNNSIVRCFLICIKCCVGCIESIVKFITKLAYVEIAIYGYSFCKASYKATKLIAQNAFRVFVIDKIGDLIFFLGKCLVCATTTYLAFLILKNNNVTDPYLLVVPLVISFLLSLSIISIFMSVLSSAIDTIFVSVCEDLKRNDGSAKKPYYMRKRLRKLLVKENAKDEKEKVKNMY